MLDDHKQQSVGRTENSETHLPRAQEPDSGRRETLRKLGKLALYSAPTLTVLNLPDRAAALSGPPPPPPGVG